MLVFILIFLLKYCITSLEIDLKPFFETNCGENKTYSFSESNIYYLKETYIEICSNISLKPIGNFTIILNFNNVIIKVKDNSSFCYL